MIYWACTECGNVIGALEGSYAPTCWGGTGARRHRARLCRLLEAVAA